MSAGPGPKTTLILVLVAACLAAFLYWHLSQKGEKEQISVEGHGRGIIEDPITHSTPITVTKKNCKSADDDLPLEASKDREANLLDTQTQRIEENEKAKVDRVASSFRKRRRSKSETRKTPPPVPSPTTSKGRDTYLIDLLSSANNFRVRTNAAISLRTYKSKSAVDALIAALHDTHPAVRAAAANSLGGIGNRKAKPHLERLQKNDTDSMVRRAALKAIEKLLPSPVPTPYIAEEPTSSGPRFYVQVGIPHFQQRSVSNAILRRTHSGVRSRVNHMQGVRLAPGSESTATAQRVLQREKRTGFSLDISIASISKTPSGIRAAVSAILSTYPGKDMRAILQGAATVQGGIDDEDTIGQAIDAAIRSALRKLPSAMAQSASR